MERDGEYLLASDVGGTFTDLVLLDTARGSVRVEKVPTTPANPAAAVLRGVDDHYCDDPDAIARISRVVHATTLVANTLVERTGARTAMLVTEGFRDLLRLRRHTRVGTFDLYADPPPALVPRSLTFAVPERVLASGKVLQPLDEVRVAEIVDELIALDVEAVAVVLLHSYLNPNHEERVGRILADRAPKLHVALSSRMLRRHMEYERANTTVASVYCAGRLGDYLDGLSAGLQQRGVNAPLTVMSSSGGFLSPTSAIAAPVQLIESGPSAGATYCAELARRLGIPAVLAFDMGGTTAKGCLITDGRLPMATEVEVARSDSFRVGSGIPLQVSAVNLVEVGSGGGSIAYVDAVGLLRVGPRSAGAEPGPACYSRGGSSATVTDADLVLGHLDAEEFLGGRMALDEAPARTALGALVDNGDAVEAARLVQEIVVMNMSAAILRHVIERGGDPERSTLVAFGGAGPVHAYALAKRLGIKQFIVPPLAGVLSAVGLFAAHPTFRASRTYKFPLDSIEPGRLAGPATELQDEIRAVLRTVDRHARPTFEITADCAYRGQSSSLPVPVLDADRADGDSISRDFGTLYQATYGYTHTDVEIEMVTVTVAGTLELAHTELPRDTRPAVEVSPSRRAWSHVSGRFENFAVRWRTALQPGDVIDGPLIIAETESATIVDVDGQVRVDDLGNLLVAVQR
jgi:N-methylhydantoinase A/oxoprolinase/acetone carboxylase beta subunit